MQMQLCLRLWNTVFIEVCCLHVVRTIWLSLFFLLFVKSVGSSVVYGFVQLMKIKFLILSVHAQL